jgi:hypothetical protein|nr:MAG TPA: hypothetical protein [Caudoviricetes sp.]
MAGLPIAFPFDCLVEICIGATVVVILLALFWKTDA